ncbi:MAG: hypothetical protein JXR52_05930 [Bacteroidales bacterium]|nr:hypothetical protein [Bacteroidales bacterium]MBN2698347.1 hypothetical protein [Bacteroidales bacterium]
MKTKVSLFVRIMTIFIVLLVFPAFASAEGETTGIYLTGSSNTPAGDFVIQTTGDIFHFQGKEYEVYNVYYDDPGMNMKIAVNSEGICKSFVAYSDQYIFFYDCNKYGFGVRKVMFSSPSIKEMFNPEEYYAQSVLLKKPRIEKKQAVGLIATFLPKMKT